MQISVLFLCCFLSISGTHSWSPTVPSILSSLRIRRAYGSPPGWVCLRGKEKGSSDSDASSWDDDVDYDKEFPSDSKDAVSNDPALSWNSPVEIPDIQGKLGIDIGSMLEPLSEKEAAEMKAAATEIINDAVAEGIDEIEKIRERMNREFEKKRKTMQFVSEMNAQRESEKLMGKIDQMTDSFLSKTELTRSATKLAAAADSAMQGKGIEMGTWGVLDGATVTASGGEQSLIGSIQSAKQQAAAATDADAAKLSQTTLRIIVVADIDKDPYAKQLLPALTETLQASLPNLGVDVYKPTATLPLGGEDAACAILFCTSLTDKSTVYNAMDRLLRKTLNPGGAVGRPPTQLVAISTIGTERTNKMPYSMQNLMGGKLDKRRQMEEAVLATVRKRAVEPALDYTICKFGELKSGASAGGDFQFTAGDEFDGTTDIDTAVAVLSQAIAFQPSARNATLSCVGSLPDEAVQTVLDDAFLRLDGPELYRQDLENDADINFDQLTEYMAEWAELLADSGKGLTTPVRAEISTSGQVPRGVKRQSAVKLLFLPTATGRNYVSREEEKTREKSGSPTAVSSGVRRRAAKEGGVEIMVEVTDGDALRVRAKRCNYADDAVIKELSEDTMLGRLKESIKIWMRDHAINS